MLLNPMIRQLNEMKLRGMSEALSEQLRDSGSITLSFEDRLSLLVDREQSLRSNRLLSSRLRQAKLHIADATLADVDYRSDRNLDKKKVDYLGSCVWLERHENLILTGATGTGKSYLACALGHKACLLGMRVQYWRVTRLLEELDLAKADGRYLNVIKGLSKLSLLILDDWGMVKLHGQQQQLVLDILDDRYQKKSTLITSQLPISAWYDQIHDGTFADAILDRMLGGSEVLELTGSSMRRSNLSVKKEG